jgi:hypothetical protein
MIKLIRKKAAQKTISIVTTVATIFQILVPNLSYALTGGPSQPEVESFTPVGTTDMVNLFTGDFNYNIPLLSVDGYPINLAYSGGPTMDEEASWVGLGWNLNPGAINRNMRGVPDDFNGETIEKKVYVKPNWTVGLTGSGKLKLFGLKSKKLSARASVGIFYNNYKGFGLDLSLGGFNISPKTEEPPKTTQDTIKQQDILKKLGNRAVGSVINMASNIFPEARILMNATQKYAGSTKSAQFLGRYSNISTNYSLNSYEYGTYTPQVNTEFIQQSYKMQLNFGGASLGVFGAPALEGTFSLQELAKEKYDKGTFGYLYHSNKNSNDVIVDINREKDGEYKANIPVLPVPISTYDLYSIDGQGVSGMIKPFRNGINVYHDDQNISRSFSGGGSFEFGIGSDLHTEIHLNGQVSTAKSEKWITGLTDYLEENKPAAPLYERAYFRTVGERVPLNTQSLQNANLAEVLRPEVNTDFLNLESPNVLIRSSNASTVALNNSYSHSSNIFNIHRQSRNQLVSFLTYENQKAFVEPEIRNHATIIEGTSTVGPSTTVPVLDGKRNANHIGEFTVTKNDGSRYIYGIAAYNNYKREVTFTTAETGTANPEKGIVEYNNTDAAILYEGDNKKGFDGRRSDRYYSSTKTKGYAHSYLLTSVLSHDYVDVMPQGVGPEDLGNYTKFEYSLTDPDYGWRVPFKPNTAQYSEGLRSEKHDNKASFVVGTKEIWNLRTIKTKNQIAVFYTSGRIDGQGAKILPVGIPELAGQLSCLYKIVLYDRMEYEKYTNPLEFAKPIKTVHFEYDYHLCRGIENSLYPNNPDYNGKLTLTKVYTTYGNSSKQFAAYKFNYANNNSALNPNYHSASIDRWGSYKPVGSPHNLEFPYVEQDQTKADNNAAVWSLSQINLPSGGIIKVNYESDDYAFVQDKRAMQMTQIMGIGNNATYSGSNIIYDGDNANNYLYFKLPSNTNGLSANEYINEVMAGVKNVCFRVMLQLSDTKYEWVNGYADVKSYNICAGTDPGYFYVELKQKNLESLINGGKKISPLAKAGFNFIKTNMPQSINPELADLVTDDNDVRAEEIFYKLISVGDIMDKLRSIDQKLLSRSNCDRIKTYGASIWGWVRLNNAFKDKLGGGYRVKKITLNDNWTAITNSTPAGTLDQENGQEFDYTIEAKVGTTTRRISSGVAAFEPAVGSEENPFKQPIGFERKVRILPDEEDYIDGPVGESFYPAAVVGYSKVTVTNLKRSNGSNSVKLNGVGQTISEFYTAKDFPVIVDYTTVSTAAVNPPMIDLLFYTASMKRVAASQGFSIVLNDMHGKPKATWVHSELKTAENPDGALISGVEYFYKTDDDNQAKLNNEVDVADEEYGTVTKRIIGVETEIYADNRTKSDNFHSGAVELNWTTLITAFGVTWPTIIPEYESRKESFFSSTVLTVKNYYGIQTGTTVYQDGASIHNDNLVYDGATGEVLVTRTTNEYHENQYNTVYPAHWKYNGMGQAYKNTGVKFTLNNVPAATSNFAASPDYIQDNDEILCQVIGRPDFKAIAKVSGNFFKIFVQDPNSYTFIPYITPASDPVNLTITVIRSGRRNMQSNPIFSATTLLNPVQNTGSLRVDQSSAILDAKAITYSNAKYNYKSFNDNFNVAVNIQQVFDAINYLLQNQQINLQTGMQEGSNYNGPGGYYTWRQPHKIDEDILNGTNAFTNSFFHQLNRANGCNNYDIKVSYGYLSQNQRLNFPGNRTIRIEIPICEVNKNVQSSISIDIEYPQGTANLASSFYSDYRLHTIQLNASSPNLTTSNTGCTYISAGGGFATITFKSISPSITPNYVNINSTVFPEVCDITITINRCEPDPYEKIALEDHLYQKNEYLAVNPITHWNPNTSYIYKGERNYDIGNIKSSFPTLNNRSGIKGVYKTFEIFDHSPSADYTNSKWKQSEQSTLIDPYTGAELESKDAIGRYRSVIFSPDKTVVDKLSLYGITHYSNKDKTTFATKPVMFTENAKHCQVNVFNFESNSELQNTTASFPKRLRTDRHYFTKEVNDKVYIASKAHTGKQSLQVKNKTSAEFFVTDNYNDAAVQNAILPYYPKTGKQYISGWVKIDKEFFETASAQPFCKLEVLNLGDNAVLSAATTTIYPTGPIIEGWQRFEGEFNIPAPTTSGTVTTPNILRLTLNSGDVNQIAYFDDIRMHPFDANAKNYVYDEQQRIAAILDENNYATFYYYDHKGELAIMKRETEKGIVTITETRKASSNQ